jgi:N,N'-diacetyllegionaminate synthase
MTLIVAEIGVNWNGDFSVAKEMIHEAKKAGADLVKFQSFNEKLIKNHPEKKRLIKTSISKENIEEINKIAKSEKIEWFCTPMYKEAVEMLDPFVKRYKIREFDGRDLLKNKITPLLKAVLATKKNIIISSQTKPPKLKKFDFIKWLYCVPKYPCSLSDLNFKDIKFFDGYSNHCLSIVAPITAVVLDAEIIEVHITPDKKSKKYVDNNVSFDYKELKKITKSIREVEKITKY